MGLTKPKIVGGVSLPDLTDPAAAADILAGKEAIAEDGAVLVGTHVCKQLHELFPALSNPATAADVASGKQFVDNTGAVVSGTLNAAEVVNGYTDVPSNSSNGYEQTLTIPDLKGKENFFISLLYEGENESNNSKQISSNMRMVTSVRKTGNTIQVFGVYGGSTTYQLYHTGTSTGATFDKNTGTITLPSSWGFYYVYSYWSNYGNYRYAYAHYYYVGW